MAEANFLVRGYGWGGTDAEKPNVKRLKRRNSTLISNE